MGQGWKGGGGGWYRKGRKRCYPFHTLEYMGHKRRIGIYRIATGKLDKKLSKSHTESKGEEEKKMKKNRSANPP